MKDNYFELKIPFSRKNYDDLYTQLTIYGQLTLLEEDSAFIVCFDKSKDAEKLKEHMIQTGLVKEKDILISEIKNKDWNKAWKDSIKPVKIGRKMIVYPSWLKEELGETGEKILIEIDPKTAFGTGHNETTQLVLELMSQYVKGEESTLLDFGCGTGILSIAGLKLGVGYAVAIDNDPEAVAIAQECVRKNNVHKQIRIMCAGIDEVEEEEFEIICANIISSVILENFEHITNKISLGGKLFLSGILMNEDQEILDNLFSNDFDVEDIQSKGEWIGIYAVKR